MCPVTGHPRGSWRHGVAGFLEGETPAALSLTQRALIRPAVNYEVRYEFSLHSKLHSNEYHRFAETVGGQDA